MDVWGYPLQKVPFDLNEGRDVVANYIYFNNDDIESHSYGSPAIQRHGRRAQVERPGMTPTVKQHQLPVCSIDQ
jgi:hypothetical protein